MIKQAYGIIIAIEFNLFIRIVLHLHIIKDLRRMICVLRVHSIDECIKKLEYAKKAFVTFISEQIKKYNIIYRISSQMIYDSEPLMMWNLNH